MTPAESLIILAAAQATEAAAQTALTRAREAVRTAEQAALEAHATEWMDRARLAFPAPPDSIELFAADSAVNLDWVERRQPHHTRRRLFTLLSTTKGGGVRLRVETQAVKLAEYTTSAYTPTRRALAVAFAEPITSVVSEGSYAGNTREARRWVEKFAAVRS